MVAETLVLSGGVSTSVEKEITVTDLAPNNYITIVWKDKTGNIVNTLDIDDVVAKQYTNELLASVDSAISNNSVSYAGQNRYLNLESIGKYLAQNSIDAGARRTVVNALIGAILGKGDLVPDKVIDLTLNVFGTITDKVARNAGWTDPHEIYAQLGGQNTITVLKDLCDQTRDYLTENVSFLNRFKKAKDESRTDINSQKTYVGLLLGLTTSDTESYEITIPRRKVESGSDYTTHLLPQPFKKDFSVILTNKVLSSNFSQIQEIENIETIKNRLIEIAQSHTLFDVYIRLSGDKMYKKSNVYFSSLSFDKSSESGNGYTCTFSIEPIREFKTKTFVSNKRYKASSSSGSSSGASSGVSKGTGKGGKSGTSNRSQGNKTSKGQGLSVGFYSGGNPKKFKTLAEAKQYGRINGFDLLVNYDSDSNTYQRLFIKKDGVAQYGTTWVKKSDLIDYYQPYSGKLNKVLQKGRYRSYDTPGAIQDNKGHKYLIKRL